MTIQTLEEKVQKTATQTANTVKDCTGGVAAGASSVLDEAKTAVGMQVCSLKTLPAKRDRRPLKSASRHMPRVRGWPNSVARWIEEQPLTALLVAGAIGVAIGYLVARR